MFFWRIIVKTLITALTVLLIIVTIPGCDTGRTLAKKGSLDYRIVISPYASISTVYGVNELQKFLKEMTGADIPIVSDLEPMTDREIIIGNNKHLDSIQEHIDFDALGDEGYVLKTAGKHLVIAGGELRGNLYGVYGFLEDHLGCRWFTPEISRIPEYSKLVLPELDETVIPVLEYREPYIWDAKDGNWAARNRKTKIEARAKMIGALLPAWIC